jgi:3D (Asp-Asp-Asp) domain-containing protein
MSTHPFSRTLIALTLITSLALITEAPPAEKAIAQQAQKAEPEGVEVTAQVTSYSSDPAETDDTPDITASGTHTHAGTLACPRRYPFGTRVKIAGIEYVCEDRMNRKYPDRFDVWSPSKEAATAWGLQAMTVTIIQ